MARNGGAHDADGAGAGDQHVLADDVEGERGVDGIAERIEDGAHLVVDRVGQRHDVEGGIVTNSAKAPGRLTPMPLVSGSRWKLPARLARRLHADDVALARDALADLEVAHVGADGDDLAGIFVAGDHRDGDGLLAAQSSHL